MKMLTEYYKFHKDISRLFMLPTTYTLNKFHDKTGIEIHSWKYFRVYQNHEITVTGRRQEEEREK